jgi:uncharacterized membrane protein YczE
MKMVYRILFYILGLFFLAFSVTLAVSSNLGVIAGNTFPYILSFVLKISLGTCVTGVFFLYVLLQFIILRKEFKPINLLQLVFSALFGYFVAFTTMIIGGWVAATYFEQLLQLALSVVLTGLGVVLYINVQLVPMPPEGFLLAIMSKAPKFTLGKLRIIHDCIVVLVSVVISLIAFSSILGIREGTLVSAICSGLAIEFFNKFLSKPIKRICFSESKAESSTVS